MRNVPKNSSDGSETPTRGAGARLPRWKRIRRNMAALAFGLAVALVVAEIALRVIGYSSPSFLRPHPIYGWLYKPHLSGWYRLEGKAWLEINERGFRDIAHSFEKPAGTYRIAVLGDSYTAAQEVDFEARFTQVLERLLNDRTGGAKRVEVINLGCSGYGTAEELLVWRNEARRYEPDLVLLAFLTGNDITDNAPRLEPRPRPRPFFELEDGELEPDESFRESNQYISRTGRKWQAIYWLLDHSRVAQLLNTARLSFRSTAAAAAEAAIPGEDVGLNVGVYSPPQDPSWEEAWRITEALVAQLDAEVQSAGAEFAVVTLSNSGQVTPDENRRQAFIERLGVEDLFYPERRVAAFCAARDIPCLNLAPTLLARAQLSGEALHGFGPALDYGHWNERGHEAGGKLIAEWLAERFVLTDSARE
jgi:lysophospholipase L1-like esterase